MRYALVGYGKMGRAIEAAAAARGHELATIIDRRERGRRIRPSIEKASWRGVDVAFEFTQPAAAKAHVVALLSRGIRVVCGTTGWDAHDADVARAARRGRSGAIVAANFSVGVNLFFSVVEEAARAYLGIGGYDPWIAEWHHRAKLDAPSGTARKLAAVVASAAPERARVVEGPGGAALERGDVHVAAVRAGHEAGRHAVGFDGPTDTVTLEHVSRGRSAFAEGAVLAAEWLDGRKGIHGFEEVLRARMRRAPARRRGR